MMDLVRFHHTPSSCIDNTCVHYRGYASMCHVIYKVRPESDEHSALSGYQRYVVLEKKPIMRRASKHQLTWDD